MKYDYLVVGSGLYGAVFAYEAKKKGKTCLVIDKRPHIGGNIYCENIEGINVHKYGAHIFHTSNKKVWDYINQFAEFNNYINSPVAIYKDELYNLPFNMNTFSKMWNIKTPQEAKDMIAKQVAETGITEPKNLEEQGLSLVGKDVFEKLVKGYTEKQWGRACKDLPAFIIKRLPVRFTFDNNYFNDRYQGIPIGGYTKIIEKMLDGIEVKTDTDYFEFIKENPDIPVFLLGHSMGGYTVSLYGAKYPDKKLRGIITSGALVKDNGKLITSVDRNLDPHTKLPNELGSGVCSVREVVDWYGKDPYNTSTFTTGLCYSICDGLDWFADKMKDFAYPVLMMHGEKDGLVSVQDTMNFFATAASKDRQMKIYGGLFHEILNQYCRDEVIADVIAWMDHRI